mgnify:CR=1 FL=1
MTNIKPVSDLRNYTEVLNEVRENSPVYLTRNGRGEYAIIKLEELDKLKSTTGLYNSFIWRYFRYKRIRFGMEARTYHYLRYHSFYSIEQCCHLCSSDIIFRTKSSIIKAFKYILFCHCYYIWI